MIQKEKQMKLVGVEMLNTVSTFLKIKVLHGHSWVHEEPLTTVKPFHCTKSSL